MNDQSPDRIARTAGGGASLYVASRNIHPRKVAGANRSAKTVIAWMSVLILTLVPWIRWDRGLGHPDQAILFDFVAMRAYVFDTEIWPQEFYFLTGVLVIAAIGLFLVTALYGRVWCGFACPQTVWTDIFVWIERLVEGDHTRRHRLDAAPWSVGKAAKKLVKHVLWIGVSLVTSASFLFFFNDAPTALSAMAAGKAGYVLYGFVIMIWVMTYLMAGWAREQMCIYMCPWPRFQGAMLDRDSLVVSYDAPRGESRGHAGVEPSFEGRGHCVDCRLCVQVCPVGIDIRDGIQMACIGCGLCADACDTVMTRFGLPSHLVGWHPFARASAHAPKPRQPWYRRPRPITYGAIMGVTLMGMGIAGAHRRMLDMTILHDRSPLSVALSDGSVRNDYTVKIINRERAERHLRLEVEGLAGARLDVRDPGAAGNGQALAAAADRVTTYRVSVRVPAGQAMAGATPVTFRLSDSAFGDEAVHPNVFIAGSAP